MLVKEIIVTTSAILRPHFPVAILPGFRITLFMPDPQEEFHMLVDGGRKFVEKAGYFGPSSVKSWRSKTVRWLKQHFPATTLAEDILLIPPPSKAVNPQSGRGLNGGDIRSIQRILSVLLRAQDLLYPQPKVVTVQSNKNNTKKVFVVHGHNENLKTSVARLIEHLELEPVILHEQPNKGRTIIEKFLDHADVSYAVVLLTADDKGGLADEHPDTYQPRARQNVILELGYFIGKLSRTHVDAIYQEGVEIPSDYQGVIFIPHDERGVWRLELAREMKAAGLPVDLNKI